MRKVLLATTAIVAVAGVAKADISISGKFEMGYQTESDDTTYDQDAMFQADSVTFSFTNTTDTGLTISGTSLYDSDAGGADESSFTVGGDFGSVTLGQNDGAGANFMPWVVAFNNNLGSYDASVPAVDPTGASLVGAYAYPQYRSDDEVKVTYTSPSMGGFSFGYSMADTATDTVDTATTDTEANTSFGASYSGDMGGVSVHITAMMEDSGEATDTSENDAYGISLSSGGVTLAVATGGTKTGTTIDSDTSVIGVGYQVNDDLSVAYHYVDSENSITSGDSFKANGISASYNIASGLNFSVSMNNYEGTEGATNTTNDGSNVRASLVAKF
jgi:outer membrane protein OmpU